jgi:pSer/pThr/pTyr-binding forkhead associated (FHA) protein
LIALAVFSSRLYNSSNLQALEQVKMINLDRLEAKIQALVENQLTGLLPGLLPEERIIQKLAAAVKQNISEQKDKGVFAPNVYTLIVAVEAAPHWQNSRIVDVLKSILQTASRETGLKFESAPTITITTDETFSRDEVSVVASHKLVPVEETQGMAINSTPDPEANDTIPENAFLIIEGVKVHPLKEPVVNIGRRLENHIVIDDPRISRNHAQLRAIKGRFVLFDLNSTGGTFVNGQRTSQTVLYPGDVISLAGVALIFGQDNPPIRPDLVETAPLGDPGASDRPTATMDNNTVDIKTGSLGMEDKKKDK